MCSLNHLGPTDRLQRVHAALTDLRQSAGPSSGQTLDLIRALLFPTPPRLPAHAEVCLVLGSHNCGYRVRRAFEFGRDKRLRYVLAGGGLMADGETEAAFMRTQLMAFGVSDDDILCDNSSTHTLENLHRALPLIRSVTPPDQQVNVVLVTGGFHLVRTMHWARHVFAGTPGLRIVPLPAYGPHTAPDSWHLHELGRSVISDEVSKLLALDQPTLLSGKFSER